MFGFSSSYSLLNNAVHLNEFMDRMKVSAYDFFCYADDNLYGMHQIYRAFENTNIRSIVGLKIILIDNQENKHLLNTYPINNEGYEQLLKLAYYLDKDSYISYEMFINNSSNLLVLLNTYEGAIIENIIANNDSLNNKLLLDFKTDVKHFYLGITLASYNYKNNYTPKIVDQANQNNITILPLHEVKYLNKDDEIIYEVLKNISGKEINKEIDYSWKSMEEIKKLFVDYKYVFNNLESALNLFKFKYKLPKFNLPKLVEAKIDNPDEYIKVLSNLGLEKRLTITSNYNLDEYKQRLNYELDVIKNMGYSNYFLIVYDFVKYAKNNNILVGPGRGSAAGSLVSYCLGITEVDPIKYNLLFERFLNPERVSMPDIDLDFPDYKREEVINYVGNTYGSKHVASIQTFQTFGIKSSIRDVIKVLDLDKLRIEGIVKNVINNQIDESDNDVVLLDRVVKRLDGIPRQTGTHAAGIVLAKEDLTKHIPLKGGPFKFNQTQYDMNDLKDIGLLKIDFLGLKNLSIIEDVVKIINETNKTFELSKIPLDDKKTFELLSSGNTNGIFQLESSGIKQVLKKIKPNNFEDIVATLALYRPGPMDSIDLYVKQKTSKNIKSIDLSIDHILKPTYGIIIYQEQIMQIANLFAGYTLAQADILRRGISEKDSQILNAQRQIFVDKAINNGKSEKKANEIYDLIVKFASYGFNRSHSVAYSLIAYQMAYLKANYHLEFMSVLLNSVIGNETLTASYILELRSNGIIVKNPNLFKSSSRYKITDDTLLMPLTAIKSIGEDVSQKIFENNHTLNKVDFLKLRLQLNEYINEKQFENLVYANALSDINLTNKTLLEYKEVQSVLFASYIDDFLLTNLEEFDLVTLSEHENKALGFNNVYDLVSIFKEKSNQKFDVYDTNKQRLKLLVKIVSSREITTKNNEQMAFITFSDFTNIFEVTAFPKIYSQISKYGDEHVYIIEIMRNLYKNEYNWVLQKVLKVNI